MLTDIRRRIFQLPGGRFQFLDLRMRDNGLGDTRRHPWFVDQYKHPHESKHTIGEVIKWFDCTGFGFINSVTRVAAVEPFPPDGLLFGNGPKSTTLDHFVVQAGMLLGRGREGRFFVMIGRSLS